MQQIAILLGCAVLPHLKALVDIVKHGLTDENQKVCRLLSDIAARLHVRPEICMQDPVLLPTVMLCPDDMPSLCLPQVKTITALTVAALAEAAAPYGIESFDDVLEPLWKGIRLLRGKVLAAFLKVQSGCFASYQCQFQWIAAYRSTLRCTHDGLGACLWSCIA